MRVLGDFTLTEALGPGELGERFLAVAAREGLAGDSTSSCLVEVVDEDEIEDRDRVAATLFDLASARRMVHPHIEPILGAGRAQTATRPGLIWIARPLQEGWSLSNLIEFSHQSAEPLPVQVSIWLVARIAETLEFAHRKGLLHGALGPNSVWLGPEGELSLRDLGLGGLLSARETRLAFRAPELLVSDVFTPRADVYGLGMILASCLLGRAPFERSDTLATRRAILEHRVPPLRTVRPAASPRMDDLLARLCALEPEARPPSAADAAELMKQALGPSEPLVPRALARHLERLPPAPSLSSVASQLGQRLEAQTQTERFAAGPQAAAEEPRRSGQAWVAETHTNLRAQLERFELQARVQREGPIEVFNALDHNSSVSVRLRVLDLTNTESWWNLPADMWRQCFEQEKALAASLSHPSVARFRESGSNAQRAWIVYTRPPARTLAQLRADEASGILLDLARMLVHFHERHILACGLCSRSIRVSARGLAVFWDLSRLAPLGGTLHPRLAEDPFCLSPEYVTERRHDRRSDLFALGTLAYELLSGTRAFRGLDRSSLLESLRTKSPRPPNMITGHVDDDLSELTMRLLERDPDQRPTADAVVAALEAHRRKHRLREGPDHSRRFGD